MCPRLLDSVLEATTDRSEPSGKLDRFLAAGGVGEALVIWLELEGRSPGAGTELPSAQDVATVLRIDVATIDDLIQTQLDAILHHPRLQGLEAAWRGLEYLVEHASGVPGVKVRALNASYKECAKDLDRAIEFDQSHLFKQVYSEEFGTPGGEPYGVVLMDYALGLQPSREQPIDPIAFLGSLAGIASASFAPFIGSASPSLFGLHEFAELERPLDIERGFRGAEYVRWHSLRKRDDSRFLGLTLPRVLMRRPWTGDVGRNDGFLYRERCEERIHFLWGGAHWALGGVLIRAFRDSAWLANIRGVERGIDGGGLVTDLPSHFPGPDVGASLDAAGTGTLAPCATDLVVTDRREKELSDLGFIPLTACASTSWTAFYSTPSLQELPDSTDEDERASLRLSSLLQYMFCVGRFAHYIKVMMRDRLGSLTSAKEIESKLNEWLRQFVTANEDLSSDLQARYPLRSGKVEVRERPGSPGSFLSSVYLRPHFQLDQLSSSIKLVTELSSHQVS